MLSVGAFAKQAQISTRTLRYYESIGLLPKAKRGENNYRTYSKELLARVLRIRDLQSLGFSLDEIKEIIHFSNTELKQSFEKRLQQLSLGLNLIEDQKQRLEKLLSISTKIEIGESITDMERAFYMQTIKKEIIGNLGHKYSNVTTDQLDYLDRDKWAYEKPEVEEFISAVKKCVAFAKEQNLILGPGRGSGPASISLFTIGFSKIDPMKYNLIPERLLTQPPNLHIDVEFERGQIFVDFCRDLNRKLSFGEIQAFRMPLIDIIKNVDVALGKNVEYDSFDENSDIVLKSFNFRDVDRIFSFDFSPNALVMKYENFLPEYIGMAKINEYLSNQKICNFRDIINITALWRPWCLEIVDRLNLYKEAKNKIFKYDFLDSSLQKMLEPNFGIIIYHEDILRIIQYYTNWSFDRCNRIRKICYDEKQNDDLDWTEFCGLVSPQISDLVREESRWAFCMPHAIAFAEFTKQTAILKSLHKEIYYSEIEKFEKKHGYTWDDIGIKMKGVSLLQD